MARLSRAPCDAPRLNAALARLVDLKAALLAEARAHKAVFGENTPFTSVLAHAELAVESSQSHRENTPVYALILIICARAGALNAFYVGVISDGNFLPREA